MFEVSVGVLPQIRAGTLRPLLVTGAKPIERLPGVPPFDSAFPGVGIEAWHGVFAPPRRPSAPRADFPRVSKACFLLRFSARLRELGFQPTGVGIRASTRSWRATSERWGKVIRDKHIRAD
jgi:tripartite-type tricarboxylate transporter receptor subunit TctC